jgi:hypothetical protein
MSDITTLADAKLKAECLDIVERAAKNPNWSRRISEGRFIWGEWIDAAETALDCDDYSEYAWMLAQDDGEDAPDTFVDDLCDFALAAVRSTHGMVAA